MCKDTCLSVSPPQRFLPGVLHLRTCDFPFITPSASFLLPYLPVHTRRMQIEDSVLCLWFPFTCTSQHFPINLSVCPELSVSQCLTTYAQVTLTYSLTLALLSLATHHLWSYIPDTRLSINILNLNSFKAFKMKTKWWN